METRVLASLPVIQGNSKNEEQIGHRTWIAHEVVAELTRRIAEMEPGKDLANSFVREMLLSADVIVDNDKTPMLVLYDNFIRRGTEAHDVMTQLQYDDNNLSGVPTFDSGEIASLGDEKHGKNELEDLKKAATFQDITNPFRCEPGDTRPECTQPFPTVDPRFSQFERWETPYEPFYAHQPLEEAMIWTERDKAKAAELKKQTASPFGGPKAPKLGLISVAPPMKEGSVLQGFTSFKLSK